jgi:hypothetical protein
MFNLRSSFLPFASVMLTAGTLATSAQAGRLSYVSSTGNDANACTLAAPCRTLQHAVAATKAGGEVRLIDSARHLGPVAIDKSITISGGGATVFAGPITINAPGAVVTLRGLVLNGDLVSHGSNGINIVAAATVHIERCTVFGFPGDGIRIAGHNGSLSDVFVTDSTVRDNASDGLGFIFESGTRLIVENSHFDANGGDGLEMFWSSSAVIDRSSASGNAGYGIVVRGAYVTVTSTVAALNGSGGITVGPLGEDRGDLTLESSVLRGNGTGLYAGGCCARISNSVVTQNTTGIAGGGKVFTRQNNTVSGNGTDVVGTLTPLGGV